MGKPAVFLTSVPHNVTFLLMAVPGDLLFFSFFPSCLFFLFFSFALLETVSHYETQAGLGPSDLLT